MHSVIEHAAFSPVDSENTQISASCLWSLFQLQFSLKQFSDWVLVLSWKSIKKVCSSSALNPFHRVPLHFSFIPNIQDGPNGFRHLSFQIKSPGFTVSSFLGHFFSKKKNGFLCWFLCSVLSCFCSSSSWCLHFLRWVFFRFVKNSGSQLSCLILPSSLKPFRRVVVRPPVSRFCSECVYCSKGRCPCKAVLSNKHSVRLRHRGKDSRGKDVWGNLKRAICPKKKKK